MNLCFSFRTPEKNGLTAMARMDRRFILAMVKSESKYEVVYFLCKIREFTMDRNA